MSTSNLAETIIVEANASAAPVAKKRAPGRKAPARKAPAAVSPIAPIVVDMTKITIGDFRTFGRLTSLKDDTEAFMMMPEAIDMLDRLVVGGVAHLPGVQMPAVMAEVNRQMFAAGNPKN